MTYEALRQFVEENLKKCEEYGEFLKAEIAQLDRDVYERLHFFNLGYQFGLEKILDAISPPEGANDE